MSINLINYFSTEFKSVISDHDAQIDDFSEYLMPEGMKKSIPVATIGKIQNSSFMHSMKSMKTMKSMKSLKNVQEQKKRGKLMDISVKNKNNDETVSQIFQ